MGFFAVLCRVARALPMDEAVDLGRKQGRNLCIWLWPFRYCGSRNLCTSSIKLVFPLPSVPMKAADRPRGLFWGRSRRAKAVLVVWRKLVNGA